MAGARRHRDRRVLTSRRIVMRTFSAVTAGTLVDGGGRGAYGRRGGGRPFVAGMWLLAHQLGLPILVQGVQQRVVRIDRMLLLVMVMTVTGALLLGGRPRLRRAPLLAAQLLAGGRRRLQRRRRLLIQMELQHFMLGTNGGVERAGKTKGVGNIAMAFLSKYVVYFTKQNGLIETKWVCVCVVVCVKIAGATCVQPFPVKLINLCGEQYSWKMSDGTR